MIAVIKEVGEPAKIIEIEQGNDPHKNLKVIQDIVGGYIEQLIRKDGWVLLGDEDGRLKGLPPNIYPAKNFPQPLVGTLLALGVKGTEFCDVPNPEEVVKWLDVYAM